MTSCGTRDRKAGSHIMTATLLQVPSRRKSSKPKVPAQPRVNWAPGCPVPRRQHAGPHCGGRVTMATPQSSRSNSSTMYNCSVYRKNADHIFWFSMHNTSLGKNAEPTRTSTRCTFLFQPNLFPVLGGPDRWGSRALPESGEGRDCPGRGFAAPEGSPQSKPWALPP